MYDILAITTKLGESREEYDRLLERFDIDIDELHSQAEEAAQDALKAYAQAIIDTNSEAELIHLLEVLFCGGLIAGLDYANTYLAEEKVDLNE